MPAPPPSSGGDGGDRAPGRRRGVNAGLVSNNFIKNNYKKNAMRHARIQVSAQARLLGARYRNGALKISRRRSRADLASDRAAAIADALYLDVLSADEVELAAVHDELLRGSRHRTGQGEAGVAAAAAAAQVDSWQSEDSALLSAFQQPLSRPGAATGARRAAGANVNGRHEVAEDLATASDRARLLLFERSLAAASDADVAAGLSAATGRLAPVPAANSSSAFGNAREEAASTPTAQVALRRGLGAATRQAAFARLAAIAAASTGIVSAPAPAVPVTAVEPSTTGTGAPDFSGAMRDGDCDGHKTSDEEDYGIVLDASDMSFSDSGDDGTMRTEDEATLSPLDDDSCDDDAGDEHDEEDDDDSDSGAELCFIGPPPPTLAPAPAPYSVTTASSGAPRSAPARAPVPASSSSCSGGGQATGRGVSGFRTQTPELVPRSAIFAALLSEFGHQSFNPGQEETINRVLKGESSLLVLPTGAGKTLCYMLPSLFLPGITLVVSPLVALMQDQLSRLPPSLPGAAWTGNLDAAATATLLADLRSGRTRVLFVSPEKALTPGFQRFTASLPAPGVSLACVDEAHCVSEWSHNFRSSYLRLGRALHAHIKPRCVLALTATATRRTEAVVARVLGIPSEGVIRTEVGRPNLALAACWAPEEEEGRDAVLVQLLKSKTLASLGSSVHGAGTGHAKGTAGKGKGTKVLPCVIVYVSMQYQADRVAQSLTNAGITAAPYHAGLPPDQRKSTQTRFMTGKLPVVVATIAFGMGLDKADVRAVVHYSLPRTLEHYVQEIGRAGRDGAPSLCVALVCPSDAVRMRSLARAEGVEPRALSAVADAALAAPASISTHSAAAAREAHSWAGGRYSHLPLAAAAASLDLPELVLDTILTQLELLPAAALEAFLLACPSDALTGPAPLSSSPLWPRLPGPGWCDALSTALSLPPAAPAAAVAAAAAAAATAAGASAPSALAFGLAAAAAAAAAAASVSASGECAGSDGGIPYARLVYQAHDTVTVSFISREPATVARACPVVGALLRLSDSGNDSASPGDNGTSQGGSKEGSKEGSTPLGAWWAAPADSLASGGAIQPLRWARGGWHGGSGRGGRGGVGSRGGYGRALTSAYGSGGSSTLGSRGAATASLSKAATAADVPLPEALRDLLRLRADRVVRLDWADLGFTVEALVLPGEAAGQGTRARSAAVAAYTAAAVASKGAARACASLPLLSSGSDLGSPRVPRGLILSALGEYLTWRMEGHERAALRKIDAAEAVFRMQAASTLDEALASVEEAVALMRSKGEQGSSGVMKTPAHAVLQAYFTADDEDAVTKAAVAAADRLVHSFGSTKGARGDLAEAVAHALDGVGSSSSPASLAAAAAVAAAAAAAGSGKGVTLPYVAPQTREPSSECKTADGATDDENGLTFYGVEEHVFDDLMRTLRTFIRTHFTPNVRAVAEARRRARHLRSSASAAAAAGELAVARARAAASVATTAGAPALLTPRAMARILHGLASPAFPAEAWRGHPEWRQWVAVGFDAVLGAAERAVAEAEEAGVWRELMEGRDGDEDGHGTCDEDDSEGGHVRGKGSGRKRARTAPANALGTAATVAGSGDASDSDFVVAEERPSCAPLVSLGTDEADFVPASDCEDE